MSRRDSQAEVLLEVWNVLLHYRWRCILPAFAVSAAVLAASLFLPRKYKAEAVFERRTDMVLAEIINRGAPQALQDPRQALVEEVAGQPALDELAKSFIQQPPPELAGRPITREQLRADAGRRVTVTYDVATNDLDRVRVAFTGEDPVLARLVVNGLVQNHIERTRARIDSRLGQSTTFFRTEVQRNRALIEELENKKLAFEIEHARLLPESTTGLQSPATDVPERLRRAQAERDAAQLRVEALRRSLDATPNTTPSVTTGRNPELADFENKLRDAQNQLANLVGVQKMTAKHPDVAALRDQIEALKQKIAATPREVITQKHVTDNPKHGEIELLLATATAELGALENQCKALQEQADQLAVQSARLYPVRSDYLKLQRAVDEARRQLAFWEENLRRVEMTVTAESGNRGVQLGFIQPCDALNKPVSPNLMQVLAAAAVLGVLAGAFSVFVAHRSDGLFTEGRQLAQAFELPMFGTVSEIISARERRLRRLRHLVFYPLNGVAMAAVLAAIAGAVYLDLEQPALFARIKQQPGTFLRQHLIGGQAAPPAARE